ncbi:type 1 glutamine amidotransferase domain-containing protein [Promicromonospora sp. MEB111]|uniref:type 1 glutamine amidotransferase domain-containing protein n=1 Tax=Promicromonospora sp. MEB111 TaxID=3040301 RepID=UPI0025503A22|nr:type 1 glutamine amidotransferase domain-containing protein [Promicromonospora sp. MEB111]
MPTTTNIHVPDNRAAIRAEVEPKGRIAILTADRVEDIEFFYPYYRFTEEGYDVDVLTPAGDEVNGYKGLALKTGVTRIDDATASDYDALFIPGGLAPSEVREIPEALKFVNDFADTGRLIGAVCHGPQILISAGLATGRRMTSWRDVAPEVREAGAEYVDEPVVEDGQYITSRKPGDMPRELARFLERLADAKDTGAHHE